MSSEDVDEPGRRLVPEQIPHQAAGASTCNAYSTPARHLLQLPVTVERAACVDDDAATHSCAGQPRGSTPPFPGASKCDYDTFCQLGLFWRSSLIMLALT